MRMVGTLHTWQDWATGSELTTDRTIDLANELSTASEPRIATLVEPIESWLADRGTEPPSASTELKARHWDFGIDL